MLQRSVQDVARNGIRDEFGTDRTEKCCGCMSPPIACRSLLVLTWVSWFFSNDDSNDGNASPPPLKLERPRSLSLYSEEEQKQRSLEMNTVPTPVVPDNQTKPFVPVLLEAEKTEKNVKPSPSCGQEVATGTTQHGHLDLKFYHSPLW